MAQRRWTHWGMAMSVAAALLVVSVGSADAFWSRRNLKPFNPGVGAPQPYDPYSVGYGGTGAASGGPNDCYWSREQVYIRGRLTWRPLLMCMYPSN